MNQFRIEVRAGLFPYDSHDPDNPGMVHAVVIGDVIYCSRECLAALQALPPGDGSDHKTLLQRMGAKL